MRVDRRNIIKGGALAALAAATISKPDPARAASLPKPLKKAAVFVPGYHPEHAYANGRPLTENRRFNRAVRDQPLRKMLTRVGFDGSIRQTLLPVAAHDVEEALRRDFTPLWDEAVGLRIGVVIEYLLATRQM